MSALVLQKGRQLSLFRRITSFLPIRKLMSCVTVGQRVSLNAIKLRSRPNNRIGLQEESLEGIRIIQVEQAAPPRCDFLDQQEVGQDVLPIPSSSDVDHDRRIIHSNQQLPNESCEIFQDSIRTVSSNKGLTVNLKYLYDVMYYAGVSTYPPSSFRFSQKSSTKMISFLQKATFGQMSVLSVLYSVCQSKYSLLNFLAGKGYASFVDLAFHFVRVVTKLHVFHVFVFKKEKTSQMVRDMDTYEFSGYHPTTLSSMGRAIKGISWGIASFTVILSITKSLFSLGVTGWSLSEVILTNSFVLSEDLHVWTTNINHTYIDQLTIQYGTNLTATTIILGCLSLLLNVVADIQIGLLIDLILLVTLCMYIFVKDFINEVETVTENVSVEDTDSYQKLQSMRENTWIKYKKFKKLTFNVNDVYDPVLKLLHVGNLLMYAYFMSLCILKEGTALTTLVLLGFNLMKAEMTYYIAGKIADQNDKIRVWIRNWAMYSGKIHVNGKHLDVTVILDELDKEPIGLGKGNFVIHQTFHFKFLGLVGSTFLALADEYKQEH